MESTDAQLVTGQAEEAEWILHHLAQLEEGVRESVVSGQSQSNSSF